MSRTWKHEWKYKHKVYWEEYWDSYKHFEVIKSDSGEIIGVARYTRLESPKDRSFNPPAYFDNMWQIDSRKRWIKKVLWKRHRHAWKQALHKMDVNELESLPRRPERYAWIIW